jgi:hypothetical protein
MKQLVVLIALLVAAATATAQDLPEYRLELGGGAGMMTYVGDLNGNLLRQMQPLGEAVVKYKSNPRMAWALNIGYGQLKGSSKNIDTFYPELQENPIEFKSTLVDVGLRFECNFWAYGTGREYYGARPLTPFMTFGLGLTFANPGKSTAGLQMPLGFGVKYKLADRLNLTLEWTIHFTGSDKIDGVSDPYGIKSGGLFKNADGYSILGLRLTYDLWEKCKSCNNDRE